MTGRKKLENLLSEIQRDNFLSNKLGEAQKQYRLLQKWSNDNSLHVAHDAVEAFLEQAGGLQNANAEIAEKIKTDERIALLRVRANEIAQAEKTNEFYDLLDEAGIETLSSFQELVKIKDEIKQRIADAVTSVESVTDLDAQLEDFNVLNKALEKFKSAAEYAFQQSADNTSEVADLLQVQNKAVANFHDAVSELNAHATRRYNAGYVIGGSLLAVGAIMIAAALAIACPPVGGLALGLLIGGGVLATAGALTLFGVYKARASNLLVQVVDAMENEEKRVLGL